MIVTWKIQGGHNSPRAEKSQHWDFWWLWKNIISTTQPLKIDRRVIDVIFEKGDNCPVVPQGVTRGQGENNSPGAEWLRGSPKRPNIVTSTFFKTVHLLPKNLRFEHGGARLASCPGRHLASLRPCVPPFLVAGPPSWLLAAVDSRSPLVTVVFVTMACNDNRTTRENVESIGSLIHTKQ